MALVWMRCRAELRAKWRTAVVLALLLGIGGGVALTAFAGARRTDQAVSQFVAYSLPDDGGFLTGNLSNTGTSGEPAGTRRTSLALTPTEQGIVDLPEVAAYFRAPYLYLTTHHGGRTSSDLGIIGVANRDLLRSTDRPLILSGHLPDPRDPFAVTVNELAAQALHLHVGSRVHLYAYSAAQIDSGALSGAVEIAPVPNGPAFTVRVAAIARFPEDVSAVAPLEARSGVLYEGDRNLYVTPGFCRDLPRASASVCSKSVTSIWLPFACVMGKPTGRRSRRQPEPSGESRSSSARGTSTASTLRLRAHSEAFTLRWLRC